MKSKVLNSWIKTSVSGIRYARNTPVAKVADPQNFIRASENAASTLINIVIVTTRSDTTTEFRNHGLLAAEISALDLSEVINM